MERRIEAAGSSDDIYRAVFAAANDGIALQYPGTWVIADVNQAMCDMYGYSKEEFMHINPALLFSGEDPLAMKKAQERLQAAMSGHLQMFDWHARHRDGHTFWIQVSLKLMKAGAQEYVLSIVRDVTDRKKIEEELRESKTSLEQAQQLAHLGSWRWDGIKDVVTGSVEAQRILGVYGPITRKEFIELIHPEDRARVEKAIRQAEEPNQPFSQEFRFLRRDGSVRWVYSVGRTVFDNGKPRYTFGTIQDFTERKNMEDQLRQRELEVTTLLDSLDAYAFLKNTAGVYLMVNRKMCDAIGRTKDEVVGKTDYDLYPPSIADRYVSQDRAVMASGEPILIPEDVTFDRGRLVKVAARKVPLADSRGHIVGVIGLAFDITEIKNKEQAVEEARAQAELFLDLMGHDINNMNHVALGYLEIALNKLRSGEQIGPADAMLVEKPLETLESSSDLIQNVKKLQRARSEKMAVQEIDIGEVLTWVRDHAIHAPGREIIIDYRPAYGLKVMANELIRDLFTNLVTNAVKHSDPKKPLHIRILIDRVFEEKQEYYKVSIEDNGPGIPDDAKRQIFSRLQPGRGHPGPGGLGLYLVSTLASQFNGRVWVEDRIPGDCTQGSRFVVMLPALRAEDAKASEAYA